MSLQSARIYAPFWSSCSSDLFFLFIISKRCGSVHKEKRCGSKFLGASPLILLWYQNHAFFPFFIKTAWKRSRDPSLQGTSDPTQGLESSTYSCQSHWSHRALPNLSWSVTPIPLRSFGLLTVGQLTRQWPPFAFLSPFQRKDLIMSIFCLVQTTWGKTIIW